MMEHRTATCERRRQTRTMGGRSHCHSVCFHPGLFNKQDFRPSDGFLVDVRCSDCSHTGELQCDTAAVMTGVMEQDAVRWEKENSDTFGMEEMNEPYQYESADNNQQLVCY